MRTDPGGVVYPAPLLPRVVLDKKVPVTRRDGICLAVDVYKPAGRQGPWPAILDEPYPATFVAPFHYMNPVTLR